MCKRAILAVALGTAFLLANDGPSSGQGKDERKEKDPAESLLTFTNVAPRTWTIAVAKIGTMIIQEKDYIITELPEEMNNSFLLQRNNKEYRGWPNAGTILAKKNLTVYAMVSIGKDRKKKDTFDEEAQAAMKKDE
jgi:hypothetical protein